MRTHQRILLGVVCLFGPALSSRAAAPTAQWSWSFNQSAYTVGPHDSILVQATVYNAAASTGHLRPPGVSASFTGDFQKIYAFKFGTPGVPFGTEFLGLNLAPGESFQFNFGLLTPIGSSIAPGTYLAAPGFLNLDGTLRGAENRLQVTVAPKPSSVALLSFAGVAGLILTRLGPPTP